MAAIIRVRDENGNVVDIPAIVGAPGVNGANGEAGYTPLRGTYYWTDRKNLRCGWQRSPYSMGSG